MCSAGKESICNGIQGDLDLIPPLGRSPGEGKGYPLQYSGLKNSMNCRVHGVTEESDMTGQLSLSLQLLYNVVLVSAAQQCECIICMHISPPSWTSLSSSPHPTPLDHHRALYSRYRIHVNPNLLIHPTPLPAPSPHTYF